MPDELVRSVAAFRSVSPICSHSFIGTVPEILELRTLVVAPARVTDIFSIGNPLFRGVFGKNHRCGMVERRHVHDPQRPFDQPGTIAVGMTTVRPAPRLVVLAIPQPYPASPPKRMGRSNQCSALSPCIPRYSIAYPSTIWLLYATVTPSITVQSAHATPQPRDTRATTDFHSSNTRCRQQKSESFTYLCR